MDAATYYEREPQGSQAYGAPREGRTHTGDDYSHSTRPDTVPVPYVRAGKVTSIQRDRRGLPNGYGNQVQVTHADGSRFTYSHLGRITATLGDEVTPDDSPGTEGTTGWTSGPCMHLEYWTPAGARLDPSRYVRAALVGLAAADAQPLTTTDDDDQEDDDVKIIQLNSAGTKYELRNGRKRSLSTPEWNALRALQKAGMPLFVASVTKADLDKIPGK